MTATSRFERTVRSWAQRFAQERALEASELDQIEGLGVRIEEAVLRGIDEGLVLVDESGTFRMRGDRRDRRLNFLQALNVGRDVEMSSRPALSWEWYVKVAAYVELVEAGWRERHVELTGTLVDVIVRDHDGKIPLVVEARASGEELRAALTVLTELTYEQWRGPESLDARKFAAWTRSDDPADHLWAFAPDHDEVYEIDYLQHVPRLRAGASMPEPDA